MQRRWETTKTIITPSDLERIRQDLLLDQSMRAQARSATAEASVACTGVTISGKQVVSDQQIAIANPAGGETIDTQARTAVVAILDALRAHGLIAT